MTNFGLCNQAVSEEKICFRNQPIRHNNFLWWPRLLMDQDEMSNFNRRPSIDASYQDLVHLTKQFQWGRFLRNQPIRNKNFQWRPCLLLDQDETGNLYNELSIDASYQDSDHLEKLFQRRRFFRNRLITSKNCLWWPYLSNVPDEMRNLYRGSPIDASCEVSVHLANWFQRRIILKISQSEKRITCGGYVC